MEEKIIAHSGAILFKKKYFLTALVIICFFVCIYVSKLVYYRELEAYIPAPVKRELTIGPDTARSVGKSGWQVAADVAESQMKTVAFLCDTGCRLLLLCYLYGLLTNVTVTDRRVYGRDGFGRKVNLPLHTISGVRYTGKHGIILTTWSGIVRLPYLKKANEVYDVILQLLWKKQNCK